MLKNRTSVREFCEEDYVFVYNLDDGSAISLHFLRNISDGSKCLHNAYLTHKDGTRERLLKPYRLDPHSGKGGSF